jgi:hypothetical protein
VVGDAGTVVNGEHVEDGLPAVGPADQVLPVLPPAGGDEVEDLERCLLGREVTPVPDRRFGARAGT